jgi:hypothetical protein
MKRIIDFLILQMLIGIWLFIQPLTLGANITGVGFSDMLLGAVVAIVGLGAFLHETSFEGTENLHYHCHC